LSPPDVDESGPNLPMSEPLLLDDALFAELVAQIGEPAARSVIELFLSETDGFVAAIVEGAAATGDPTRREAARRAAHSLKSSAGQMGAAALAEAARRVEAAATVAADFTAEARTLAACADETAAALALWSAG
jgi:HPt (histidine-containing phosphotransfer) domain-containing protein